MIRKSLTALVVLLSCGSMAQALELAWKGGAVATETTGCPNWDPKNNDWWAYLWPALANTTNSTNSTFSLHNGNSSEGFRLKAAGNFAVNVFKAVEGVHVYTGAGTYPAQLKLLSQTPVNITTNTPAISGKLQIKGFGFQPTCLVTISYSLVRHIENP